MSTFASDVSSAPRVMLAKITEALSAIQRVPTQLLVVVAVAAALILFIPENLAVTLAVDEFRTVYRIFVGPGLLVVAAWLVARFVAAFAGPLRERRNLRNLQQTLDTLTSEEKGYLTAYIEGGKTTIYVQVDDGIIGGLLARKIVFRSSNTFDLVEGVPYNLQPWARTHLSLNPGLLEGAKGQPMSLREKFRADRW